VRWNADAAIVTAITKSASHISEEVLALEFTHDASLPAGDNELQISAELVKA
jgi:isoleucyl-tRNA synthetase